MQIGAQLFTVRDFCKTLDDFSETLKKVADIGYKSVQVSATCEFEPEWLKKELDKNGLVCAITHTKPDKIAADPEAVARDHKVFGCKNVGIGSYSVCTAFDEFKEKFLPAAKVLKNNGCYLMYHNHDKEFSKVDGKLVLDMITEAFAPDELGITLDTFWVQAGGADPAYWLNRLSGRTPCVHFKDMSYGRKMEPIGYGNMNYEAILKACVDNNVEYGFVEQDNCNGEDPFECLKKSYDYLTSMGFK